MAKHVGKKFSWVIKDFSSLQSEESILSDPVLIGDYKWHLRAYPKGDKVDDHFHFPLFLEVADLESLPSGWRRYVKFRVTILPHDTEKDPVWKESHRWFDKMCCSRGFFSTLPPTKIHDKDEGFLVNGEVIIVAEVDVLEVIGTLDESEKSKASSRPLKKIKRNNDCVESNESLKEASSVKESMVINGFQVLPSQVETVKRIFERHPDIVVDFRAKNQHLRTSCLNFLLSLIETLRKSFQELSNEDLEDADIALTCLKDVNFKVDWLEKKLDQVKEKKEKEQSALAKHGETEENILKLKEKLSEQEALAEEQKAELLATRATLSFDDIV